MMDFDPDAMGLIDSPLLQRLRGVKQCGFTYLTYPSADHSRFSHSLGVAHVVSRLLDTIEKTVNSQREFKAGGETYTLYSTAGPERELRSCLIHAALLHDCGHIGFSHAGESAFKALGDTVKVGGIPLQDFMQIFRNNGLANSDLSECLSICVCMSPRFRQFYGRLMGLDADACWARLKIVCSLIAGIPHVPDHPGLANLISGAVVDADKIDYINRDARACGIPVGIDVSRIFLHTSLVRISPDQAKKLSSSTASGRNSLMQDGVHFIVNSTGIDTYEEVTVAKSILYNRVYLHQFTRNAEQLLTEAIRRACRNGAELFDWYPYDDEEMLGALHSKKDSKALAIRIRRRQSAKRALVLYRDACEPFIQLHDVFAPPDPQSGDGVENFEENSSQLVRATAFKLWDSLAPADPIQAPQVAKKLKDLIREAAIEVRTMLDPGFDPEACAKNDVYVGVASRFMLRAPKEVLVRQKNSIRRSVDWTKAEELSESERVSKAIDYVYADREWVRHVRIAAARVIFDFNTGRMISAIEDISTEKAQYDDAEITLMPRLKLNLGDIAGRVGFDYEELVADMEKAGTGGFFEGAERVVPLNEALYRRAERIAERFKGFLGERGWHLTPASTAQFLRQFPVGLRLEVATLLENGVMLDRRQTFTGIAKVVADIEKALPDKKMLFCRFSPNSGDYVGMLFEADAQAHYLTKGYKFLRSLDELERAVEADPDATMVFLDDQFATGGQAEAQLRHWMGQSREEWPKNIRSERNIDLSAAGKAFSSALKKGSIALAFVYGTEVGKLRVERVAKELGIRDLNVRFSRVLEDRASRMSGELQAYLKAVGLSVLAYCRGGKENKAPPASELEPDSLGYGGHASLVVTPNNVPSHVITALWCPGVHQGHPWIPLFLRRGYRKDLVLC